jgi:steroid delta-isomerase-like uncharacterized protein
MSDENKQAARRIFSEVWNEGTIAILEELVAPDVVDHNPVAPNLPPGLQGFRAVFMTFLSAFPDLHMTVEDMISDGDKVVVRWTASGSQQGPLMGIPPTSKTIHVSGIEIYRFAGGKIADHWGNFDMLGLLQQIGVVPIPGQ